MTDDELDGVTLGGYRLGALLGSGGMGSVYRGVQVSLGRPVAIKVLRAELTTDAGIVKRFRREAELAASLSHPNIAQVTDFGVEEGRAFLVMDLLEGDPLSQLIEREGRLDEARVVRIAVQILTALAMAHERGVVHRDLKPENIFVQHVSGMDLVKLLDFGIARMLDADLKMTGTGAVLGTPAYMSPEQARGKPVDARSDVFSLGAVLYEALAGHRAFAGENYHELMFAVVEQQAPPLAEVDPDINPALAEIIDRALAKDSDARFAGAAEMKAAFEEVGNLRAVATTVKRDHSDHAFAATMASEPEGPTPVPAKEATPIAAKEATPVPEKEQIAASEPSTVEVPPKAQMRVPPWAYVGGALGFAAFSFMLVTLIQGDPPPPPVAPSPTVVVDETEMMDPLLPHSYDETDPALDPAPDPAPDPEADPEPDPEPPRPARPSAPPTRLVQCGRNNDERTVHRVRRRDRMSFSGMDGRRGEAIFPGHLRDLRALLREPVAALHECYLGHYMDTSQRIDVSVDADGNATRVSPHLYCPIDPSVVRCMQRVLLPVHFGNDGSGAGEYHLHLAHDPPP